VYIYIYAGMRAHKNMLIESQMLRLCEQLDPDGAEQEQCEICGNLELLLRHSGQLKSALILHHQVPSRMKTMYMYMGT